MARRYFKDVVLRQDAADEAVNSAVDEIWQSGCLGKAFDEQRTKTTMQSSLRQSSRTRKLELANVVGDEYREFHAYRVK